MGLLNFLSSFSNRRNDDFDGYAPECPDCGADLIKDDDGSWICPNCSEALSEWDAADIWGSSGEDEDYTFGYDEDTLRKHR